MENPKIRWIEALPFSKEGKEMILLRDPEGIAEQPLIVSREGAFVVSLMDGTRSLRDIQAECMRTLGSLVYREELEGIVNILDAHLLLASERFAGFSAELRRGYEAAPLREPFLAGKSYPSNRKDLLAYLDEMFRHPEPVKEPGHNITGILAPHIDYARGREVYQEVYRHLRVLDKPLIVIFGTCHHPTEKIWNISLKDFSTPLDRIPVSPELAHFMRTDSVLRDYVREWPHRNEHSIELQLPLLQFAVHADFEILPILTGSMHEYVEGIKGIDDGEIEDITGSLRVLLEKYGKPYLILSGADLAHIGAQFGDNYELDVTTLARSKGKDMAMLEPVASVDGERFFHVVRQERDKRRICGLAPIFFQLKLLSGNRCEVVSYRQWTDGQSSVSFAGALFYGE
jgi:AmmeMemoRadiSam system protein B